MSWLLLASILGGIAIGAAAFLLTLFISLRGRGGYGGWSSGGGGLSGGGGGGGFGGGGASGRW